MGFLDIFRRGTTREIICNSCGYSKKEKIKLGKDPLARAMGTIAATAVNDKCPKCGCKDFYVRVYE